MSCTINPILYNLLSRKFRHAFKRTLCRCCLHFESHSIPAFYKLRAKFVGAERPRPCNASDLCYIYPDNNIRLAKFVDNDQRKGQRLIPYAYAHPSTKETSCKNSSPVLGGISSAHAHSDGRLHRICHHKFCSSRRGTNGQPLLATPSGRSVTSYPAIHCQAETKSGLLPMVKNDDVHTSVKNSCVMSW